MLMQNARKRAARSGFFGNASLMVSTILEVGLATLVGIGFVSAVIPLI